VRATAHHARAVRRWSSVSSSFCRLLELPEMASRHPLLKPLYGGLQGRFPCVAPMRLPFASKIVEHSRYLPKGAGQPAQHLIYFL
jgi:hypothetical protein